MVDKRTQKKLLLVSQVFYPDEVSTAGLFTDLCAQLVKNNVEVEVWCAQPSYTTTKKQPKQNSYKGINIRYLKSTSFPKTSLPGRLLNYLTFSVSLIFRILITKITHPVATHTTPPTLGMLLALVSKVKRISIIYILLDIFPDGLVRLNRMSAKSVFTKMWAAAFRFALRRSYKIVVIGRDMKEWVKQFCIKAYPKTEYIPLWQNEELIKPVPYTRNSFVTEQGWQNKFIVQYSGNMGLWQDMKSLARAAFKMKDDQVDFVFIGSGMRHNEFISEFSGNIPPHITQLPLQPLDKINLSLTACHVALVSLHKNLEGMAVPSKIYGILAAGIPTVAVVPLNSEIAYIIEEERCGIVVNNEDVTGMVQAIRQLKSNTQLRKQMGQNARKAFENKYRNTLIAKRYIDIL